jgi:tartronate-semialdehyde synthase
VLVMINNISLGLIRQSEVAYGMNYNVDLAYTVEHADGELSQMELGLNYVKVIEAMGGLGQRVERPEEIRPALEWAKQTSVARRLPVLVEVMVEREANAAMGSALNAIIEYEPLPHYTTVTSMNGSGSQEFSQGLVLVAASGTARAERASEPS